MNQPTPPRMHDVIIVGGSYAGVSAGLQLARARRDALVLDAGLRRNRTAAASHGFLGQDGQEPGAIAAKGKAELLAYPTVTWQDAAVTDARPVPGGFAVRVGGDEHLARRLVLATGVVDDLPAIPGLRERWGRTVFHCPYCHAYAFRTDETKETTVRGVFACGDGARGMGSVAFAVGDGARAGMAAHQSLLFRPAE
jgi:thioredoxin reductase